MEILESEIHVLELDGFLNALRCVIGHPSKLFGAGLIKKGGRELITIVEESIANIEASGKLKNKELVNFKYIQEVLNIHIYAKLPTTDAKYIENIDWNIIEYYGLISTAEDEHGAWNRLVGQENYILEYIDEHNNESVIFFVEHDDFVIATCL